MQDKCNAILELTAWQSRLSRSLVELSKITPRGSAAHIELNNAADAMVGVNIATQRIQDILESELRELEAKDNARN
tara:strand:- start:57 stop:284 length:228 start_codon:yes stop_codon:yes gene_type:complete